MIRLEYEMRAKGLTKTRLGALSGVNQTTIGAIVHGRMVPYDAQLRKLADALGWDDDPGALMDEATITFPPTPREILNKEIAARPPQTP